jgi:membrane fusion protein, heavy metal efflux system
MLHRNWAGLRVRLSAIGYSAMVLMLVFFETNGHASAHEGHDHGQAAVALPATINPRAAATGDEFEAVAVLKAGSLLIFVDRFADNSPVTKAAVTVTVGAKEFTALPAADGTYRIAWPADAKAGRHDLVIGIQDGATSDLLVSTLDLPATTSALTFGDTPPVSEGIWRWIASSPFALPVALLLLAIAAVFVWRRKTRVTVGDALSVFVLIGLMASAVTSPATTAQASDEVTPNVALANTGDAPRRLADGSVFLPKPTQRLLDVRTLLVKDAAHRASQTLVGRVIANPNRSGLVQSNTGGRMTPPAAGLPRLGQTVKAGDVLGYVTPAFQAIDSANVAQAAGDLEQQIELARTKLERAQRLLAANAGTRVQAEEAELMLKGLERRRAALSVSQVKAEPLFAPVDGVISSARAVPGQVVSPQDILFEVIDGRSLWVEALVFDASSPGTFEQPTASTQNGASFSLTFVGRSRSLRQQSAILHFEITAPSASLDVGTPVTVHAQLGEPITAIVLPRAAVVRSANGEDIVWRHTEPERYVPTPVKISPFDGARVLVQAGLSAGQRIVVQGGELISQVR